MAWGSPWAQRQGPPRIDLLPRELVEQRLVRRQRGGIGAGFLVLLALLGVLAGADVAAWYAGTLTGS